jgi:hypothetical protein
MPIFNAPKVRHKQLPPFLQVSAAVAAVESELDYDKEIILAWV